MTTATRRITPATMTRRTALRVAAGLWLFVCATSASATPVYYLEIPGVTGPVDAPGFNGAFDVNAFSFGVTQSGGLGGGGGGGAVQVLNVLIPVSAGAAPLTVAASAGKHFPLIYLDGFKDTSSTTDYFKLTLEDALIASISFRSEDVLEEQLVFDFSKISYSYTSGTGTGSGTCGTNGVACPSPPSVPEPASVGLLGLGAALMFVSARRRRRD